MADIRVGILGCARINQVAVIDAAAAVPGIEVTAIASRSQQDAEDYAAEHGIKDAFGSYQALLDDPDIDLVYNPLPNHLHAHWTCAALAAGKHVLVEKPLAANADEARRMIDSARLHARHLIEAFHYRHHPMLAGIRAELDSAAIGRIRRINVSLKVPERQLEPDDIRLSYACAGGATMDLGAYGVNLLRWLAGGSPVVESATATVVADWIDGAMEAQLRFANGIDATMSCSLIHDAFESRLEVVGDNGLLRASNPFLPQFGNALRVIVAGRTTKRHFATTTTYTYQLGSVVDLLAHGKPISTPGQDGEANMQVIDAIYRAAGLPPRGG